MLTKEVSYIYKGKYEKYEKRNRDYPGGCRGDGN